MEDKTRDRQIIKNIKGALDAFQEECLTGSCLNGIVAARVRLLEAVEELRPDLRKQMQQTLFGHAGSEG